MSQYFMKGRGPIMVLVFFFLTWECVSRYGPLPIWLLPGPSIVWKEGVTNFPLLFPHLMSTTWLSIIGFSIGAIIGLLLAVGLHLVPGIKSILYPFLILSQNVPIIVLAPLLVIWFGFGFLPKIIIISLVCFFPITIASLDGLKNIPNDLMHYMKMSGASKWQIFSKLEFPHSLPTIFSGLKISATYSVMGAVISEWLGSEKGIGVYMTLSSSSFRTDRVFLAIFLIITLSLLFYLIIEVSEKIIIKWKPKEAKR